MPERADRAPAPLKDFLQRDAGGLLLDEAAEPGRYPLVACGLRDLAALREHSRQELMAALDSVSSPEGGPGKALVLDPALSGPLGLISAATPRGSSPSEDALLSRVVRALSAAYHA